MTQGDFPPPEKLEATVSRGLSAICMKAMSVIPADRYRSAKELAAEIECWLADEPIAALPDTQAARLARFARRNYRWLVPSMLGLLLATIAAGTSAVLINEARGRAELAAQQEAAGQATGRSEFQQSPTDGRRMADRLYGGPQVLSGRPRFSAAHARARGRRLRRIRRRKRRTTPPSSWNERRTYLRLGDIRRALLASADAKTYYERALELLAAQALSGPLSQQIAAEQARGHGRLALVAEDAGDRRLAETQHRQALEIAERLDDAESSDDAAARALLANLQVNFANTLARGGDLEGAAVQFECAERRWRELVRREPGDLDHRVALATALLGSGQVHAARGHSIEACRLYRDAAAFFSGANAVAGDSPQYLHLMAQANILLGTAAGQLGDVEAEIAAYSQAIAIYDTLIRALPHSPAFPLERCKPNSILLKHCWRWGRQAKPSCN